MKTQSVIVSLLGFTLDNEHLTRIRFCALDNYGTILKTVTCPTSQLKETIENYCTQYKYQIS
jgi:hypothetical protein